MTELEPDVPAPRMRPTLPSVAVEIPEEYWEDAGTDDDLASRLLATLYINGTPHHVEAWEVRYESEEPGGSSIQTAVPEWEEEFQAAAEAFRPDGHWQTCIIRDREYVVFCSPFC